jgi:hypothetical protein
MIDLDLTDLRALLEAVGDDQVLTLHLPVDPSDPDNQRPLESRKWRIALGNDLASLGADLVDDRDAQARFRLISAQVMDWVTGYRPGGRTVVLLADGERVLSLELPVLLQQQSGYGPPQVAGLVRALSDHRLYACVLVDREAVRLVTGFLGFVRDEASFDLGPRWGMPGETRSGHQFRFESRGEKYQRKLHTEVARQLEAYLRERPEVERVILGGNEVEAHGVARALGHWGRERLVGVVPIPVASSDIEVAERVAPHAERFEEEQDLEAVGAWAAAQATGLGAAGKAAVLGMLDRHRVRHVLVSAHLEDTASVEEITRRAVAAGAGVRFVHQEAADRLDMEEGVVARLYYAVNAA